MANSTSDEIGVARAAIAGMVFVAPRGTTLPTDAVTNKNASFVNLGHVGEEGFQWSRDVSTEDKKNSNGETVYNVQTDFVREATVTFMQAGNVDLKKLIFGDSNVTTTAANGSHGAQITTLDKGEVSPHKSFIVETYSGTEKHREVIEDGQVTGVEISPLVGTDIRFYTATIKTFPAASDGAYVREYDDDGVTTA